MSKIPPFQVSTALKFPEIERSVELHKQWRGTRLFTESELILN